MSSSARLLLFVHTSCVGTRYDGDEEVDLDCRGTLLEVSIISEANSPTKVVRLLLNNDWLLFVSKFIVNISVGDTDNGLMPGGGPRAQSATVVVDAAGCAVSLSNGGSPGGGIRFSKPGGGSGGASDNWNS